MKKVLCFVSCCAALSLVTFGGSMSGRDKARPSHRIPVKHVVLIGVDGLGIRNIAWDRMPNLRKLRDKGAFAVARSTFPTSSGVNWSSALCGTTPDLHGVRDNTPKPGVPPAVTTARGSHPCIFSEVRRQEPNAYTCSLYDWNGIGWYHDSASANYTKLYPSNFESESQYTDEFIELLKKNSPRLAFITYDMCDHTGHAKRYDSPEYANACAEVDKFIGRIADYVAANGAKDTAIVLFSDHGGHDNGHGDTTLECYEIPFLVYAPGLDGYVFREPVTISDVAPTVAWLLGYKIPDFWRGRPALRPSARYPLQKRLIVHAGKGNGAPENTLPAFKAAVATGFGFECDIQMSADHQIFAAHNPSALAYSGKDIPFKTMPWSEIEKIDVGRRLGGVRWAGTPPPRFEDILALMRDGRTSFVEVKESAGTEIVPYIKKAVESQKVATPKNMAFISFDREICRALRKALPQYEVLWITLSHKDLERKDDNKGPVITADELIALLKDANLSGVDMLGDMSVVTEEYVKKVKAAGFKFGVWTVDDTKNARILLERGVDAVTTNRSKEIAEELKEVCLAVASAFATPIRLGSWNIRLATMDKWEKNPRFPKWEARMPHVTGLIAEKGFDLMGLQEVCSQQADFIRKTFPGWGLVGVATNDVERGNTGHANGIFYRQDRFKVLDWGWFAISDTPDVPGSKSWGTMCVRSCTWALMEDMGGPCLSRPPTPSTQQEREHHHSDATSASLPSHRFLFFNTHFDHRSQEAREKGMALILEKIAEKNPDGIPVILMGDFNSHAESPQIQMAKKTLSRAYEISETPPTGPFRTDNCWKFVPPEKEDAKAGNRIDHIFLTPGTRVMSHETFGDFYGDNFYPSDHFPLKAVIAFPARQSWFQKAVPVWPKDCARERNAFFGFRAAFDVGSAVTSAALPDGPVILRITGCSGYRVSLNGRFVGWGPARAAKGYFRVDEIPLPVQRGRNVVAVEVAGYNCNSFCHMDQPSFLQAEVVSGGTVLAATASQQAVTSTALPVAFEAQRLPRVQKVVRYSFQRPFSELYRLRSGFDDWKRGEGPFAAVPLEACPRVNVLPRRAPYADFRVNGPFRPVSSAKVVFDANRKTGAARFVDTPGVNGVGKGFAKDELEVNWWDLVQRYVATNRIAAAKCDSHPLASSPSHHLCSGDSMIFDAGLNDTGFLGLRVTCRKPGTIAVKFDEVLVKGEVSPTRYSCANVVVWEFLEPGEYEVESFEPYTLKFADVMVCDGDFEVSAPSLRTYKNPEAWRARMECSDPAIMKIFAAARETYAQNAADVFTDCPGRERAGWLCDSFFTGRSSLLFTGNLEPEHLFLENYVLPERFDHLPDGMLAMCYPGDFLNGQFIPNWAMWLVIEVEEFKKRGGDPALVEAFRPKLLKLVNYLKTFKNADGLLEKLPSWVFVEWSRANDLVQDVNYPSNMAWAEVLDVMARLYGLSDFAQEAAMVRETVRRQAWTGKWFCDNAVRQKDGSLKLSGECTETCQYYAFFFRTATPGTHPALWKTLVEDFGPKRKKTGKHKEIWPSNAFIGNYLRLECLSREGLSAQILDETRDFFLYMADATGTLWENISTAASCNHGFASHVAVSYCRDIVGVREIDRISRKVTFAPPTDVPLGSIAMDIPVGNGDCIRAGWRRAGDRIVEELKLPSGWSRMQ